MKISLMDSSLPVVLAGMGHRIDLWKCHQCGQCSSVCQSQAHRGIRPRETIERAMVGAIDLSVEKSIWACMMCQGCTERCQLGADPSLVITVLRNIAAEKGNRPQLYAEEAKLFIDTGLSFPRTGLTRKLRKEMGLDDVEVSEEVVGEIRHIVRRTGLGRLGFEG